jgi:hypothetical protein
MWEQDLVEKLTAAKQGGKRGACTAVIREYGTMTGKSPQQLYRVAKRHGYTAKRKRRSDAGECVLSEGQIMWIASQIKCTARELKGPITPVAKAVMDAEDNRIIEPGQISASRMAEILRERGLSAACLKAPTPHTHMRSLHPNHVHLIDMSICIQFYLKGRLRIMPEDDFYKNKYSNFTKIKNKLIRYILVDHYSGCFFVKYYYAAGETADNLFDFLMSAWAGDKHPQYPFRGVPFFMLMDAGAANTSKAMLSFFAGLGVDLPKGMPHNPRRQGGVEVIQNVVERWFESSLRIQPATTVEQLNGWAVDFCAWFNAEKRHSRHGMTRTQAWLKIRADQLRERPGLEILQELYAKPEEERLLRADYAIRYNGADYDLRHLPDVMPGMSRVKVVLRPFTHPEILVRWKDGEYLVQPVGRGDMGFREDAAVIGAEFKGVPESATQRRGKVLDRIAYGDQNPTRKDAAPHAGAVVMGNKAAKIRDNFMPRTGTPHAVTARSADWTEKEISIMEAIKRLKPLVGAVSTTDNQAIRARYGTAVPVAEITRITEAIRDGQTLAEALAGDGDAAQTGTG